MNNLAFLKLMSQVVTWAPWVALATIAAVALTMAVRHRRHRRRPENPITSLEIDTLERTGKITGEEAQFLRRQTGKSAEAETEVAKPHLLLRLAAVISRIYAVMMLVVLLLVAIVIVTVVIGRQFPVPGWGPRGMDPAIWKSIAAIGVWLVLLVVSIGQFVASYRVLDGSRRARNWLAGSWLLCFACTGPVFGARYWAPAAGLFVLWVLFWRPGVMPKISTRGKWLLPVTVLGLLLMGFAWKLDFSPVATQHSGSSSGYGGIPARLERLYLLCGTPDASTRRVAAKLAKQLQAAGIPAVLADSGEVPMLDSGREMAIWIGRGTVAAPAEARTVSPHGSGVSNTAFQFSGKPGFQFISIGNFRRRLEWRGLAFPSLSRSFQLRVAVAEDSAAGEDEVVKTAMAQLRPGLRQFVGPDALGVPEVALPTERTGWLAPELQDFRTVLQSRGRGCQVDVYRFTPGDPEADRNAVKALLARNGFRESGEYNDTLHFDRSSSRGYEEAAWYYWVRGKDPQENGFGVWKMEAPVGLLVVESLDERVTEPDPAFATQFFAADPTAFLCSGGINQLTAAERETALVNFFAQPDVPRSIRMKVLQEGMRDGLVLSDREKELLTAEFRKLAMEIVAAAPTLTVPGDVDVLRKIVLREPWRSLESWLVAELKDICIPIELAGEPDAKGLVRTETRVKLSDLDCFLKRIHSHPIGC